MQIPRQPHPQLLPSLLILLNSILTSAACSSPLLLCLSNTAQTLLFCPHQDISLFAVTASATLAEVLSPTYHILSVAVADASRAAYTLIPCHHPLSLLQPLLLPLQSICLRQPPSHPLCSRSCCCLPYSERRLPLSLLSQPLLLQLFPQPMTIVTSASTTAPLTQRKCSSSPCVTISLPAVTVSLSQLYLP